MWQTEEVREGDVSPLDEVRGGLAVFEQTLWEALPQFVRHVDRALGEPLPLDAAPLGFGSWIGGDRDGNPNVTPEVTRKATWMARWVAADLYIREIDELRAELSVGRRPTSCGRAGKRPRTVPRTPSHVAARLRATRAYAAADRHARRQPAHRSLCFSRRRSRGAAVLCHRSLVATGNTVIAEGV